MEFAEERADPVVVGRSSVDLAVPLQVVRQVEAQLPTLVSFVPFDFSSKQFLQSHTRSGPTSTNLLAGSFLHVEHRFRRCRVLNRVLDL
jgi:hypothetical protein